MHRALLFVVAASLVTTSGLASAQEQEPHTHARDAHDHDAHDHEADDDHDHDESSFHSHRLELGISPGLAYIVGESDLTLGLHMHLVARVAETRWGLGVGLERLFDEHGHTTASAVVQLRLLAGWSAIFAVGATFEDGEGFMPRPGVHLETTYEWEIGWFHVGPSLELALDPEDIHVTLGLHMGFGVD